MNEKIFFCQNCKRKYFCDVGLGRTYDGFNNTVYTCPYCNKQLILEEVDKIIISRDIKVSSTDGGRTVTKLEKSQISELCDIKGLTPNIVREFSEKFFDLQLKEKEDNEDVYDLLIQVASFDDKTIELFYNALFRSDYSKRELLLQFSVFATELISEPITLELANTSEDEYDLKIIDKSKKEIWVFVSEKDMDLKNLELFAQKVFGIDFKSHSEIKEIFIISRSFSYMSKQIIAKYQQALTAVDEESKDTDEFWRSLRIRLWEVEKNLLKFREIKFI
ncbi:MAG: hypothetical protein ACTSW1_16185 [Candidatus Hodarchaeales archaeon]